MNRPRTGLTLLELVVVLAVLAILAGLVLPKLDGVLSKGHSAHGASAIGELGRYMETYRALNGRYPDLYDSMMSATGVKYTKLLPGTTKYILAGALTPEEVASLDLVGVRRVWRHDEAAEDVNSSADLTLGPVTIGTTAGLLLKLDPTNPDVQNLLIKEFRQDPADVAGNRTYLVFGVGPQCTICNGKAGVMRDAPLHQDTDPGRFYNRLVVIFATSKTAGEKAELIGVVGPDGDSMAAHLREFFSSPEP